MIHSDPKMDRKNAFKILVVDDSAVIRKLISDELTEAGFRVEEAVDGLDALVKASAGRPPDLITLDVEMPRMNGFLTCEKLREPRYSKRFTNYADNQVPIIFITSLDTIEDRRHGFKFGASDFITKPFERGTVVEAVNQVLKPSNNLTGLKVLLVDDSKSARMIISKVLQREGLTVLEAEDGQEAYEIICKQMTEIDLLVTDLHMPKMNGDELCFKVRQELDLKSLPIIFLTASDSQDDVLKLFKVGANDYLIKPFVKEELMARLQVHLQRARLNKRLHESVNELKGLNQMKDELIAVCSHDLRSPLNGIMGFTDLLVEKEYLHKEDKESLQNIKESGEFLLSLINDILDLSKIQSEEVELEKEPVSLVKIAETSINAMRHMAEAKSQAFEFIDNTKNNTVLGNSSALLRTFNNLLSNAIKFTPEHKKIAFEIGNDEKNYLKVVIQDQGIGIPEDKIPFLFDKFSKTSRSGTGGEKGTGLGMSIIKEMVVKHDGIIDVVSIEGEGTKFTITLPCAECENAVPSEPDQSEKRTDPEPTQMPVQSRNILVAEDNRVNQKLARKILEKAGHTVIIAENGLQALAAFKKGGIDIIFMDVNMPEMNGLEATREIISIDDAVPVVALTGATSQKEVDQCKEAGMLDILTKPFNAAGLQEKILQYCRDD
jgi:CheY-like chemotaxis protein/two-component sensor histidine kinase